LVDALDSLLTIPSLVDNNAEESTVLSTPSPIYVNELRSLLNYIQSHARFNILARQSLDASRHISLDKLPHYRVGDKVWLLARPLKRKLYSV
jgi:hypothetical protein